MRRIGVSVILVLVLLLAATSASVAGARHKTAPKCVPGHRHLIAADTQAQVYLSQEAGPFGGLVYRGCAYGSRRSYVIGAPGGGSSSGASGTSHVTLAGPIVAFEDFGSVEGAEGGAKWLVVVRDLRTGRVVHEVPTGTQRHPSPNFVGVGPAVAIVVKSDGAVAWILERFPVEYEVHAVDASGNRLLASGAEIDPSSLALAGSTLYWTQGGQPESARLN